MVVRKAPGRRRIPGVLYGGVVVDGDAPEQVLAKHLALAHIADIDIVQRGPLRHAVEIQLDEAAELAHGDREGDIDDAIHRRSQKGDIELNAAEIKAGVHFLGIDGHFARETSVH